MVYGYEAEPMQVTDARWLITSTGRAALEQSREGE